MLLRILHNIYNVIGKPGIKVLFGLAVLYFAWGVYDFIRNAESDEGRAKGWRHIIWGLVGIFIMTSAISIINLIAASIGTSVPPGVLPTQSQWEADLPQPKNAE